MTALSKFLMGYSGHFRADDLASMPGFGMSSGEINREIAHLLRDNKIALDSTGTIGWIYDTELFERYHAMPELRVR
ncbi:hypothetical protein L0665_01060 [Methanogenium marinum]|uniref:Uncharacterized protein n=1 Tax=Methanogenium marinum TaxID=348610 RepID=A0A9Q4KRN8_9EURY|nr:hypothetical protein [Methanogenium marinum]MDE4907216.1 hypothetical protein [Methanogenium marinum]